MLRRTCSVVLLLLIARSIDAQTIYFKKDHVYAGPGGPEIAIITPPTTDTTPPSVPAGVTSSNITSTSVQINWAASTDTGGSGLGGYKLYRQQGSGARIPVKSVGVDTLSFVDQGPLVPSTLYTYRLVAFDKAQNHSEFSSGVNVTTLSITDTTAPATPTGLTGYLLTRNSVRLTWNRSIDIGGSGISGYKVYRGGTLISGASPIANPTYEDTGLAYSTSYSYTITAIDNANNASAATGAFTVTTDRELLQQDNFNRLDGALVSPWTVALGSPAYNNGQQAVFTLDGRLVIGSLQLVAAAAYPTLTTYVWDDWMQMWVGTDWHPTNVWSQVALQPSTNTFKASIDVISNTSAAGLVLYTQAATGQFTDPTGSTATYSTSRGFRALLQSGSVVLQNCSDVFYLGAASSVCSTLGSAASVETGTLSVETNSTTGTIKVYVNGALKITSTVSTGLMSGGLGGSSLGYYDYVGGAATTYHTAKLDNFLLERN